MEVRSMTIREFWHDIRERFSDQDREGWRSDDERQQEQWRRDPRDRGDFLRNESDRSRYYGAPARSSDWSEAPSYPRDRGSLTSGAYDPGLFTGESWNADVRSRFWRERNIEPYGAESMGYANFGEPARYSADPFGISYRGRGPQNWRRSDARIHEDVCELMTEDDDLDPSEIEVTVRDGEITLTGTVESRQDKRRAENLAERVPGVRDVHNHLQVQRARDTFLGTRDALAGSSMGSTRKQ
jgi:hypothetical protein